MSEPALERSRSAPTHRALCVVLALLALLAVGCADPATIELRSPQLRAIIDRDPFQLRVLAETETGTRELLTTLPFAPTNTSTKTAAYGPPAATRDRYEELPQLIPGWDGYRAHEAPWQHALRASLEDDSDTAATFDLELSSGELSTTMRLTIELAGPRIHLTVSAPGADKTTTSFVAQPDEHFFGMGERYASVDHRGLSLYSWAEEAGLGRGENSPRSAENPFPNGPSMTYFPVPFFISTAGYAVHIKNTHRSESHFASEHPGAWRISANASELQATIYLAADPRRALELFTEDTGRPLLPAPWVFGPRRRVDLGATVDGLEEWRALRARGVPTTGIDDAVHFLPHRSELGRESALISWTSTLHAHGFKVMGYYNPFVSESLETAGSDFQHGKENGYFVRDRTGQPGLAVLVSGELQNVASIDFTNPAAVEWYHGILRRSLALGYDGWMHDFGEYIGRDWLFFDGRRGAELHNLYPVMSARAARELLQAERPDDHLFFVRAGFTGSQASVPAIWGGDPEATFDQTQGLPSALRGGINLGLSGAPYWGSDIGGFKCFTDDPRDKEVYVRWSQLGAVSPIMQDQNACVALNGRKEKWTLWSDAETTEIYGKMARFHTRLQPYFLVLAEEAHRTGMPIMRHPVLAHADRPEAWAVESAFFLGSALYVAPVVARGEREKTIWLPPGRYVDLDHFEIYEGGAEVTIPAPLERLPTLLVEGQLLPLLDPAIETLAPATEAGVVTIDRVRDRLDVIVALAPGSEASLTLADGTVLRAKRTEAPAAMPAPLAEVSADQIADCSACFTAERIGGVDRLRVTTGNAASSELAFDDLQLSAGGPIERRIRWDVRRVAR